MRLNGHPTKRLPNTLNVSFGDVDSHHLLAEIPEIAASTGAACHANMKELSHVLRAMGILEEWGFGTVRFSLGKTNTAEEIDLAIDLVASKVNSVR